MKSAAVSKTLKSELNMLISIMIACPRENAAYHGSDAICNQNDSPLFEFVYGIETPDYQNINKSMFTGYEKDN